MSSSATADAARSVDARTRSRTVPPATPSTPWILARAELPSGRRVAPGLPTTGIIEPVTSTAARLPTFFILGSGRSGTTSLARALAAHPDVFIPTIKEPSFFASSFQWVKDPARYVDLYEPAAGMATAGDASHVYLEDPESPRMLRAFFPDAKFVVVFRDPVDRALALYAYMVGNGYEWHRSFESAVAAEERRFHSDRFRRTCRHSFWNYMYVRSGFYGSQIERYLEYFDRNRFWFSTLDRLIASPGELLPDLHRFLGVEPLDVAEFPLDGTSKGVRSVALQYVEQRVIRSLARRTGAPGEAARTRLNEWNKVKVKPAMQPETRVELQQRFRPDLVLLRELTGVDLVSRWS